MVLQQRGGEFAIRVSGQVLMGSRSHGSEEQLARAALKNAASARPRILVGGLGMGFTLRAVLDQVGQGAQGVVAELLPAVIAWNDGPLAPLAGSPLRDPRVEVFEGDVARAIRERAAPYDAILLDVDNGPAALTSGRNAALYAEQSLAEIKAALGPKGRLVVWSASSDAPFERRLREAGFEARTLRVRRNVLFVADVG